MIVFLRLSDAGPCSVHSDLKLRCSALGKTGQDADFQCELIVDYARLDCPHVVKVTCAHHQRLIAKITSLDPCCDTCVLERLKYILLQTYYLVKHERKTIIDSSFFDRFFFFLDNIREKINIDSYSHRRGRRGFYSSSLRTQAQGTEMLGEAAVGGARALQMHEARRARPRLRLSRRDGMPRASARARVADALSRGKVGAETALFARHLDAMPPIAGAPRALDVDADGRGRPEERSRRRPSPAWPTLRRGRVDLLSCRTSLFRASQLQSLL